MLSSYEHSDSLSISWIIIPSKISSLDLYFLLVATLLYFSQVSITSSSFANSFWLNTFLYFWLSYRDIFCLLFFINDLLIITWLSYFHSFRSLFESIFFWSWTKIIWFLILIRYLSKFSLSRHFFTENW